MSIPHKSHKSLISAVRDGKLELAQKLLESNKRFLYSKDWIDYSLLIIALQRGHKSIVQMLLNLGCRVNKVPNNSVTHPPLYYAVEMNDEELVRKLLERNACIYYRREDSETPLCMAMRKRHYNIVNVMLSKYDFSKVDPTNSDDVAHFLIACEMNMPSIIKKFIEHGMPVNSRTNLNFSRFSGYTPLHFAVKNVCLDTVKYLLSHGADCNSKDVNGLSVVHLANQINEKILLKQMYNAFNITKVIDALLFSAFTNFDLIEDNSREISFFHIACTRDNVDIVNKFLEYGVNINRCVPFESDTYSGFTGLHFAIYHNCNKVVKFLIESDADVNARTKEGLTPLHFAVMHGKEYLIKLLLRSDADVTITNVRDETALHCAFYNTKLKPKTVDLLLEYAPKDVNPIDNKGLSHFHIACTRENTEFAEDFLENNQISIDAQVDVNYPGYAALHFAVEHIQPDIVLLLLQNGANVNITEAHGLSPLHLACKQNYEKLVESKIPDMDIRLTDRIQCRVEGQWDVWCTNQMKIVSYLINYKADVNLRDSILKATPLYYIYGLEFSRRRVSDNTSILLKYVAIEKVLFEMLCRTQRETAELLLNNGADVNAQELTLGRTPLHNIVSTRSQVMHCRSAFCYLTKANCNINARDYRGLTPLHLAALNSNASAVSVLLKHGADINLESNSGETVLCSLKKCDGYNGHAFNILGLHIKKLMAIGFHVSEKVKDSYKMLHSRFERKPFNYLMNDIEFDSENEFDFNFEERKDAEFLNCKNELEQLKACQLNPYCSLYNILRKDEDEMVLYINNDSFTSILNSPQFDTTYPLYGFLLVLQYQRGIVRSSLVDPGKEALNKISTIELPDSCLEQIMKYLDNDNVKKLIKTTEMMAPKRRSYENNVEGVGPTLVKQQRLEQ